MRPIFLPIALLGLSFAKLGHGQMLMHQPAVQFEMAADSVSISMTLVDGRIIVDVTLNGKGPFPFIFDTGAQGSVMDLTLAREQGLDLGQEVMVGSPGGQGRPGHQVTIEELAIGGLTLKQLTSIAFEGLPFPRTATSPRGVLGPYSLHGLLVTLDYPGQRLVFRRGALPDPDGREVFGWEAGRRLPEIPAAVAGVPITVHLDSGASAGVSIPSAFASRLALAGPLVDMGYAKTVDQVRPVRGAPLDGPFTIGRYTLERPMLRFVDMAKGIGNVGAAVLNQFVLTIDPANLRLRLAGPADGWLRESEERKPRYGIQLDDLAGDTPQVLVVDAGSPAEKGGLRASDRILRMNGRPIGELGVDERLEALRDSLLELTVRRGESTVVVSMSFE